jgi:hypothetical protein
MIEWTSAMKSNLVHHAEVIEITTINSINFVIALSELFKVQTN